MGAFYIKNDPSRRRSNTFANRRNNVLLYEMISDEILLAQLKGNQANYWTMIDIYGNILKMQDEMEKLLQSEYENCTGLHVKKLKSLFPEPEKTETMVVLS